MIPALANWLQQHLIPCPLKSLTGIDCPGCGFQRSVIELIQGNLYRSLTTYPPTIAILLFLLLVLTDSYLKTRWGKALKKWLFLLAATTVVINYGFKIWALYSFQSVSAVAVR